jgi:hypothetical protein
MRESQGRLGARLAAALLLACALIISAPAATALATTIRFMHAVPGAPPVEAVFTHGHTRIVLGRHIAYGEHTGYVTAPAGPGHVTLYAGGKQVASTPLKLMKRRPHTCIALAKGMKIRFIHLPDGRPEPGIARFRVFHAASELGAADLKLGRRTVAHDLKYASATPYFTTRAGTYDLAAMRPGGGGAPLLQGKVALAAGTTTTAYVVGSQGRRVRVLLATDDAEAPPGAPGTGLGGLARHQVPWLLVLGAAALAGAAGGALHRSRRLLRRDGGR